MKNIDKTYTSCKCIYEFDSTKCNSNQNWNNDKRQCDSKNPKEHNACEKYYIWNLLHVVAKMVNMQEVLLTIK